MAVSARLSEQRLEELRRIVQNHLVSTGVFTQLKAFVKDFVAERSGSDSVSPDEVSGEVRSWPELTCHTACGGASREGCGQIAAVVDFIDCSGRAPSASRCA